jgi:hypothetical protein
MTDRIKLELVVPDAFVEEIVALIVKHARTGRGTVRSSSPKSRRPCVFARGSVATAPCGLRVRMPGDGGGPVDPARCLAVQAIRRDAGLLVNRRAPKLVPPGWNGTTTPARLAVFSPRAP